MVGRSTTPSALNSIDLERVLDAGLLHRLAGALDRAADAGFADEHVVRFLGQHETAGARKRIEARLGEALELHLAVAIGEVGEHEERQPIRRLLVEGAQHARRLLRARAAAQEIVGLLAPVGAEIFVQEIDHRPEMAPLLDIDLKQVAHVVERGRGIAEEALLLDRRRLGVALNDDQAPQHRAIFAGHILPGLLASVFAAGNPAVVDLRREQNAPAVFRHLHIVELGPALRIDADRGSQVDQAVLVLLRDQVVPPVDVAGMPFLQRLENALVLGQADIVGDQRVIADIEKFAHRFRSGWLNPSPAPREKVAAKRPDEGSRQIPPTLTPALSRESGRGGIKLFACRIRRGRRCRSASARRSHRRRWDAGRSSSARP